MQSLVRNVLYRKCKPYTKVVACGISTDYGHPMKPFFIEIQSFWAWADKKEDKFWGFWHIFVKISAPMTSQLNFMVQWGANLDGTPELLYAEVMVHLESPKWAKLKLLMSQIVMKSLF